MPSLSSDENLLFGLLAIQLDFISRDQLLAAMNVWMVEKAKPLGVILKERQDLQEDEVQLLNALVQKHLERHRQDAASSLASLSSLDPLRRDLETLRDIEMQHSSPSVSPNADFFTASDQAAGDPESTLPCPPPMVTSGGGRFRVLRPHAAGGIGDVSVALDQELNRQVALKELRRDRAEDRISRARFLWEAEITGRLEHPGVVPVYGLGQHDDGRPFYAMRFVQGENLGEAIDHFHQHDSTAGARSIEFRKLLGRFVDVCQTVHFAHSRGVLHRDLKPDNVMLGKYGETLVVDWGLAKALGSSPDFAAAGEPPVEPRPSSKSSVTQVGIVLGTLAFMSPEQAKGHLDQLGPASDIYSLGATLYYLLTGQVAFPGRELSDILKRVRRGDFPRPSETMKGVDRSLEAICLKAMALEPSRRYRSALDLALDIERWLADEPVHAHQEAVGERLSRWARQHGMTVGAWAASVILMIASVTLYVTVLLFRTWDASERNMMTLTERQAELALAFDVAIRDYVGESIRPAMAQRVAHDEFVVEAMSSSYVARRVFEKVSRRFEDYVIKFSSENPRNPKNQSDQEERAILAYFREHPEADDWKGTLHLRTRATDQLQEYYVYSRARRIREECLRCHGQPEDSPRALLASYGSKGGFGYRVGDLAGMDVIGIPMSRVRTDLYRDAGWNLCSVCLGLAALVTTIVIALRLVIPRRRVARVR